MAVLVGIEGLAEVVTHQGLPVKSQNPLAIPKLRQLEILTALLPSENWPN